jgi:hypothetical protein
MSAQALPKFRVDESAKTKFVTKCQKGPRTWTDSLDKRPKLRKIDMRFSTLNVRNLYRAGSLRTVGREIS